MYDKLATIQQELKAPKNQYNSFGKYKYRSLEDVLEAVKPLLAEYGLLLTISDDIIDCAGHMVVEATATISEVKGGQIIAGTKAHAGVNPDKKGMDLAQSFGASSSYARKYALNGLFLIDDTKDADATNTHGQTVKASLPEIKTGSKVWKNALQFVADGGSVEAIQGRYTLSEAQKKVLSETKDK